MKFGKHLQNTQTPEWKKKYIDYRKLKKLIKAIRNAQEVHMDLSDSPIGSKTHLPLPTHEGYDVEATPTNPPRPSVCYVGTRDSYCSCSISSESESPPPHDDDGDALKHIPVPPGIEYSDRSLTLPQIPLPTVEKPERLPIAPGPLPQFKGTSLTMSSLSLTSNPFPDPVAAVNDRRRFRNIAFPFSGTPVKLRDILPFLSSLEASFFEALDAELVKVNEFYLDREDHMRSRGRVLEEQLRELSTQSKFFHLDSWSTRNLFTSALLYVKAAFSAKETRRTKNNQTKATRGSIILGPHQFSNTVVNIPQNDVTKSFNDLVAESKFDLPIKVQLQQPATRKENYSRARKKIKKAMLEHYRGLGVLNEYRLLNVTGFQKALKKFEKVTKIPALQAYLQEKVEPSAFASGKTVEKMTKHIEGLFATQFKHGDNKKATDRLRVAPRSKSHHFSTLRSGFLLGLAVPALVSGLYHAFQDEIRHNIAGWAGLLYLYGALFVPTLFSLLVGLNIMVWWQSRISYAFIFDLDARTRLDNRQYFETPAFLVATLVYSFWFSFSGIFQPVIQPHKWPLIWLGLTIVVLFNPLPVLFKPTRWWFLRKLGRLLIAGSHRVEFTDFWLADQFCSMTYTFSNLYFMGCAYTSGFNESLLHRCGASSRTPRITWFFLFLLAALPNFIRLVQSIRRYYDSGMILHLINGGKYSTSMITYLFYYLWRARGPHSGPTFVVWCIFSTIHAVYSCSWDFWMDWSIMRPEFRLLRRDLVYTGGVPAMYYFAIISNIFLRFLWVIFIPANGPSMELRSFVAGFLEILRRFQWNFYRLENEHLGNMDEYRVTKDIRLPYSFGNEDGANQSRGRSLLRLMRGSTPSLHLDKLFEPSKYVDRKW